MLEPVIEAAMKRHVKPETPWYREDYEIRSDGAMVSHFGLKAQTETAEAQKAQPENGKTEHA